MRRELNPIRLVGKNKAFIGTNQQVLDVRIACDFCGIV